MSQQKKLPPKLKRNDHGCYLQVERNGSCFNAVQFLPDPAIILFKRTELNMYCIIYCVSYKSNIVYLDSSNLKEYNYSSLMGSCIDNAINKRIGLPDLLQVKVYFKYFLKYLERIYFH